MKEYICKEVPTENVGYLVIETELIRCKDCKNYGTGGNRLNCNVFCCSMPENGFCSMGERKENDTHEECVYIITKGKAGYHEEYKCSACGDSFYWTQDRSIPNRFNYCRNCGAKVVGFVEDMSGAKQGMKEKDNE